MANDEETIEIRNVWDHNLKEEFDLIKSIVDEYHYVAMDTEFPGVVIKFDKTVVSITDRYYKALKDNVDMLKLIQLGFTFSDGDGNLPTCGTTGKFCVWQFNFREFDFEKDFGASVSIDLLKNSGIDFKKNLKMGVDSIQFAELLMSSGVVLNDCITWVTFDCRYDFGYLLKALTCKTLPQTQTGFFDLIKVFFPVVYDIKHLARFCDGLYGGLSNIAKLLKVERFGTDHQSGSDSLLTSRVFIKLKDNFFNGCPEKYAGVLWGLGIEDS